MLTWLNCQTRGETRMASVERYLWVMQYRWHGESRMWWAYFKDWSELQACIAEFMEAFPCFALQKLETCPDGLLVLDEHYAATCSEQERIDALFKDMVGERDKKFFPLAPLTCNYLASFQAGLGNAVLCERCKAPPHTPSIVR
jgi:hypothetical protein